jgi:hypothetical protein
MTMIMTEVGPQCQCGCGEHLPVGSIRKYKRGHAQRAHRRESAEIDRQLGQFDGYNFQQFPMLEDEREYSDESAVPYEINPDGSFTIADAAMSTSDDPDTDIWKNVNPAKELPIRALKDIEGKLAFMLGTTGGLLNVMDPVCGGAFLAQTKTIAHSLTPIIAQSPGIVAWFSKTSNIMLYINLAMAMWPVMVAIWTHHFSKHVDNETNGFAPNGQMNIDPNLYGVR